MNFYTAEILRVARSRRRLSYWQRVSMALGDKLCDLGRWLGGV
jgi:hypothetical protein